MTKEAAYGLGSGLTVMAIFAYGLKNKMGWKYWVFTILFLAPAGGLIVYSLVPEDKAATALQNQALSHALNQSAIEACRKRECKDNAGVYFDGQCHHSGRVLDLNCRPTEK